MSVNDEKTGVGDFVAELRRRHVVRFALTYGAGAFVVLQLAEIVFPAFGIGESGLRLLVIITTLGFPPSLVLAWVYDLSRDGIQRTAGRTSARLQRLALATLFLATVGATGALGTYLARQGVLEVPETRVADAPVQTVAYDPAEPIRSIAVLPLKDYSQDQDQAYFTASMHEELIAKLSMLDQLRVVSRTTVMRYADSDLAAPDIGRELNVDVIVEGSIARSGERTRVTLQLIHAPSDSHIETLQWDEENVDDVLAFQTEIAQRVVAAVAGDYDPGVLTASTDVDPAAQEAYFRGRYAYEQGTAEGYRTALDFFQDAVEEDPDFAPAMAGLAGARFLVQLEQDTLSREEISRAHDEAVAAIRMDSASIEAREVLSLIERSMPRVAPAQPVIPAPDATGPELRTATFVMPGGTDTIHFDVHGFDTAWVASMTTLGERIEERVRRFTISAGDTAVERGRQAGQASLYLNQGRFADAARVLEDLVGRTPELDPAWSALSRAYVSQGDLAAAVRTVRRWHESGSRDAPTAEEVDDLVTGVADRGRRGYWTWRLARLEGFEAEGRNVPSMDVATAHAALGHEAEAIANLIAAAERGEPGVVRVRTDPAWDDLRRDSRVRAIARQADWLRTRRPGGPPRP